MTATSTFAPAKINLGLEIVGRRQDGFHEIRSVLARVSLYDTLTFEASDTPHDVMSVLGDASPIVLSDNLVAHALRELRSLGAEIPSQRVRIEKRIPLAAGLGGASSDAAATIRLFGSRHEISEASLLRVAARLGSDVPFFLGEPFALAAGRGELLTPLPSLLDPLWVVLVTPDLLIPSKTAKMYRAIDPGRWSSGVATEQYAAHFPAPPVQPPSNVFAEALFGMYPDVRLLRDSLIDEGYPFVMVTGAGPTLYTLTGSRHNAKELAALAVNVCPSCVVTTALLSDP